MVLALIIKTYIAYVQPAHRHCSIRQMFKVAEPSIPQNNAIYCLNFIVLFFIFSFDIFDYSILMDSCVVIRRRVL